MLMDSTYIMARSKEHPISGRIFTGSASFCYLKNRFLKIKYFTALVTARPGDPDQPNRQQIYLRALKTIPKLEIIHGHFLEHEVNMPLAGSPPGRPKYARVIRIEEKGWDVKIACRTLCKSDSLR
jgi:hypothetical protein